VLEELRIPVNEIRVLGGGARSDIWNQIKADITGKTILRTENEEAACLGAAILAGKAVGLYSSVKEASKNMVRIKKTYNPQQQNTEIYRDTYKKYIELYDNLCRLFSLEKM
jgi:xylulokinase